MKRLSKKWSYIPGHEKPILSLAVNQDQSLLASSSSDGTVRVWEMKMQETKEDANLPPLHLKCIKLIRLGCEMNALAWLDKQKLVGGMGMKIVEFDVNSSESKKLIMTEKDTTRTIELSFNAATAGEDNEINKISSQPSSNLLCACDDGGNVIVVDAQGSEFKILKSQKCHENICLSACFRSSLDADEDIISGGLDGRFCHFVGTSRLKTRFTHNFLTATMNAGLKQTINPPLVYDVCSSANGQLAGVALGNGWCRIVDLKKGKVLPQVYSQHSYIVNQVQFARFNDNILVSSGQDGFILGWNTKLAHSIQKRKQREQKNPVTFCINVREVGHRPTTFQTLGSPKVGNNNGHRLMLIGTEDQPHIFVHKF